MYNRQRNIIFYYYITLYHIHTPTQTHFSLISLYINSPSQFSLSCFLPFTSLIKKFPSLFLSLPLSHGRPSNRLLHVRWRWFPRQAFPLQQMPPPFPTLVCLISFLHHHHHIIIYTYIHINLSLWSYDRIISLFLIVTCNYTSCIYLSLILTSHDAYVCIRIINMATIS